MRPISLRLLAASSLALAALAAHAATRPRYGGTLRVEIRDALAAADSPEARRRLATLAPYFTLSQWEPGKRALFTADEGAPVRPYLDAVEITMARPAREQSLDLNSGKADVVELSPDELRRPAPGRKLWQSEKARVLALAFGARASDARLREALAWAVDRAAIYNVLLRKQGEAAGALLPQWLSGFAFLFPATQDLQRARALVSAVPAASRRLTYGADDPANREMADRIALNARDAGMTLAPAPPGAAPDVRIAEARIPFSETAKSLAALASAFGLPEPARADSPDALYAAERALLEGFRVAPLFHLPDTYAVAPRVQGASGVGPLGEWHFENLWLEPGR
jgi:hypothetical protein